LTKPKLLDLFCCAGGAGEGYYRAGFEVVGVDIVDRPNYPHKFIKADALEILGDHDFLKQFQAIHASSPCQAECTLTLGTNARLDKGHVDLYPFVAPPMYEVGLPGVIETPSARPDMRLCGEMFGLGVLRHRNIELVNWSAPAPKHKKHRGYVRGYRHGVWRDGPYIAAYGKGGGKGNVREMQEAMGIDWTDVHEELTEAIPPAYTHYIGRHLMAHLEGSGS
jgi:DNA (cytosine-5)-methyltransferase 1